MLAKVDSKDTETVINALIKQAHKLPRELYESLTWDRGKEMADHKRFTLATDIKVYFCVPDETAYGAAAAPTLLEPHGSLHGYRQPDETANLHTWQIYPLRTQAYSGLTVRTLAGNFWAAGLYHSLTTNVDTDLTAYVSALTFGQQRFLTLSIGAAKTITVTAGTISISPQAEHIANAPSGERPLAAILIYYGQTTITNDDVYMDLRYMPGNANSGAGDEASDILMVQVFS